MKRIFIFIFIFIFSSKLFSATFIEEYPALTNTLVGMSAVFLTGIVYDFVIYPEKSYSYAGVNPRISLLKSAIYPGWGQFYNGRKKKAVLFSSFFSGGVILYLYSEYNVRKNYNMYLDTGEGRYYKSYLSNFNFRKYVFVSLVAFYVYNFLEAYIDGFFANDTIELSFNNGSMVFGLIKKF